MTQHTHSLIQYATIYGRFVQFFERPEKTKIKGYREPKLHHEQWFRNGNLAKRAARKWKK